MVHFVSNSVICSNNFGNIHACINSITGFDTTLSINIHQFDSTAIYSSANLFQVQILSGITFNSLNTGSFGSIAANNDTIMPFTVPNLGGLISIGIQPGLYYARVVL